MIRLATLDDVPALLTIGKALHMESPRFRRLAFNEAKAGNFLRFLIDSPDGWVVVADRAGRVAGGMAALAYAEWFTDDKIVADVSLFVLPQDRGAFLGISLITAFREWSRGLGVPYAVAGMSTGIKPEETTRLYECKGATRVGPIVEFTFKGA
jgi:GNAT superfamily N-acetyltransferase